MMTVHQGISGSEAFSAMPRVGGMASIPSRQGDLARVLASVLPQVDRLHLFLHGYDAVPGAANDPRIVVERAAAEHPYRESGKFFGLIREPQPCLYFCFDDDILYPADHAERLARALIKRDGKAVVGIHGVRFRPPYHRYTESRKVFHFANGLLFDRRVDVIGMGTAAFASNRLRFDPVAWPHGDMDDLMVAMEAERQGLERVAVARPRRSLVPIGETQSDSLWARARADDSRHTEQLMDYLQLAGRLSQTREPA